MRIVRRLAFWAASALLVVLVAAAVPVLYIETQCVRPRQPVAAYSPVVGEAHRRNFVDTFLTYPEWSIVHAYQDFAAVSKADGESAFRYYSAIAAYWRNLCTVYGEASAQGEIAGDMRGMLHIIGLSFSAEMMIKGNWENTVGLATTVLGTDNDAQEDVLARRVADDYAKFLVQTPWYEFPFGKALADLWAQPLRWDNPLRSIERRVSLSLEWGGKALYARAMGALAGLAPATLSMRSVFANLADADFSRESELRLVERRADGTVIVETPRYRAFTNLLKRLVEEGRDVIEIAGKDRIFVTLIARPAFAGQIAAGRVILVSEVQGGGWPRLGLLVPVRELAALIRKVEADPDAFFEHAYDY